MYQALRYASRICYCSPYEHVEKLNPNTPCFDNVYLRSRCHLMRVSKHSSPGSSILDHWSIPFWTHCRVWIACELKHWDPACPGRLSAPLLIQLPYPPDAPYIHAHLSPTPAFSEACRLHALLIELTKRREAALVQANPPRPASTSPRPGAVERGLLAGLAEHGRRMRHLLDLETQVLSWHSHWLVVRP